MFVFPEDLYLSEGSRYIQNWGGGVCVVAFVDCCWIRGGFLLSGDFWDNDHCPLGNISSTHFALESLCELAHPTKRPLLLLSACTVPQNMDSFFNFISLVPDDEGIEFPSSDYVHSSPSESPDIPIDAERSGVGISYSYCIIS